MLDIFNRELNVGDYVTCWNGNDMSNDFSIGIASYNDTIVTLRGIQKFDNAIKISEDNATSEFLEVIREIKNMYN